MNRRTLLAGIGCGIAGLSGCTSSITDRDDDGTDRNTVEYSSCNDKIIKFNALPEEVKKEVRTAFDEGEYQTNGQLLYAQVEGSNVEALERDQRYYESEITERQESKSTLSFEETTMTRDSVLNLELLNVTEETWEGTVTATDLDGDRIVDEEVTVESYPMDDPDSTIPEDKDIDQIVEVPLTDEYGEYEITMSPVGGESERAPIQIEYQMLRYERNIMIKEDGIEFGFDWHKVAPSPEPPCSWEGK